MKKYGPKIYYSVGDTEVSAVNVPNLSIFVSIIGGSRAEGLGQVPARLGIWIYFLRYSHATVGIMD